MEFIGTDADLSPQAQLETVVKAGTRIHDYGSGIDSAGELSHSPHVGTYDRLGVFRSIDGDVVDSRIYRGDYFDR